jgi:Uma2 family endonuclease
MDRPADSSPAGSVPDAAKLTYADYVTLPDDGKRYEILDGELVVTASPSSRHQRVSENLSYALSSWVRARSLGRIWYAPLDLILADTTVVVPDISYVSNERSGIVSRRGMEAAPDLVVEILSASTASRDRGAKLRLYARYGVPRYWIVDAEARTLEVYALRESAYELVATHRDDDVARLDTPEGLDLRLADVWSD